MSDRSENQRGLVLACVVLLASCASPQVADPTPRVTALLAAHAMESAHATWFQLGEPAWGGTVWFHAEGHARWDVALEPGAAEDLFIVAAREREAWWQPSTRRYCLRQGPSSWFALAALISGRPDLAGLEAVALEHDDAHALDRLTFVSATPPAALALLLEPGTQRMRAATFEHDDTSRVLGLRGSSPDAEAALEHFVFTPPADATEDCALPGLDVLAGETPPR